MIKYPLKSHLEPIGNMNCYFAGISKLNYPYPTEHNRFVIKNRIIESENFDFHTFCLINVNVDFKKRI
jgi:hypothetical protein